MPNGGIDCEDIQNKIAGLANAYHTTVDNVVTEIQKNVNILHSLNQQVITEKVTNLLVENAKVNYTNK